MRTVRKNLTGIWAGAGLAISLALGLVLLSAAPGRAADRANIEAFLATTGFDVAIDSIALSAENAPVMLGLDASDFGHEWKRVSEDVFDPALMRGRAMDILEETLEEDLLAHAAGFYASDLGQALVLAENNAHMEEDAHKRAAGEALVSEMVAEGGTRLNLLKRMNHAIDPNDVGPRAAQEIQIRFLLAASYAGVIALRVDEQGLRAAMKEGEAALRRDMAASALVSAAYTYRDFSDQEIETYAEALEDPQMQTVYELMNAVHYEIMMNRFEALAQRMGALSPGQEL
ncbi:MAG: DUF2059 domain-containing protein [Pseudopelagicola sp.]|nr:DUF2059 domain-containing protein [Pseudopelagicola sp.]